MLILNEELLINTGTNRAVYKNPIENLQCLKIDIKKNKESNQEIKYYQKLEHRKVSFEMISKYYGNIETNYGKAQIFELIKDKNGNISKEMSKYLNDLSISIDNIENILKNVPILKKYLFENRIYVKDLNPVNILFQKINSEENRLVIIDGLAHSNYNPLFYICDFFIKRKIESSWRKFIKSIKGRSVVKNNPYLYKYLIG